MSHWSLYSTIPWFSLLPRIPSPPFRFHFPSPNPLFPCVPASPVFSSLFLSHLLPTPLSSQLSSLYISLISSHSLHAFLSLSLCLSSYSLLTSYHQSLFILVRIWHQWLALISSPRSVMKFFLLHIILYYSILIRLYKNISIQHLVPNPSLPSWHVYVRIMSLDRLEVLRTSIPSWIIEWSIYEVYVPIICQWEADILLLKR